jgi:hypothetical protein
MAGATKVVVSPQSMTSSFGGRMGHYSRSLFDAKMMHVICLPNQPIFHSERKEDECVQPCGKKRRRVHFDARKYETIDVKVHVSEPATQDEDNQWLSQEELLRMQKRQRYHAAQILAKSPSYSSSIHALMDTHKELEGSKKMSVKRHISCVSENDCRGLERQVVDRLNFLRKENVRITLSLQAQLKEKGLWGTEYASEMIRKRSASISRPLRQLASHLAQLDEWEAKQGTAYKLA